MWRSILGIVVGIFVGGLVVWLVELPGMLMYAPPPGTDPFDSEAMKAHVAKLPLAPLAGVALAWTLGPLVGSWLSAVIARRAFVIHALIVGVVFLALDLLMILSIPHPTWLAVVGVIAPIISSLLGAYLAARMFRSLPTGPQPYDMREKNMAC